MESKEHLFELQKYFLESSREISSFLTIIGNHTRLIILSSLILESLSFKRLCENTGLKKSALSNHLNILLEEELIKKSNHGVYELSIYGMELLKNLELLFKELQYKMRVQERNSQFISFLNRTK